MPEAEHDRDHHHGHLTVSPGERVQFRIADLAVHLLSELPAGRDVLLPASFDPFRARAHAPLAEPEGGAVRATVRASSLRPPNGSRPIYDAALHWRCYRDSRRISFEMFHPPSGDVYCRAETDEEFGEATVLFDPDAMERLVRLPTATPLDGWLFPYPMDHLLFVPRLARAGGFLLHAAGAVVDGQALVFAGHSGDGKTTLSGLLAREGIELLSDERIAVRLSEQGFVAYGTPWPGEGDVVSTKHYPLGGLFCLRKAEEHEIQEPPRARVAAELMARSIVPYYLPETTAQILGLIEQLSSEVPLRELSFSLGGGLAPRLETWRRREGLDKRSLSS